MSSNRRKSGLPTQTYSHPIRFEDYIIELMGVTSGHESFNNNFLMAQAFMKLLPQVEIAIKDEMLQNPYTKKPLNAKLDDTAIKRIKQVWNDGIYCVIKRDYRQPEIVIERKVVFNPEDYKGIEIEKKPAFKLMNPVRDITYNAVWREIRDNVPIRYALEGLDLATLASNDGGFYKEYADGRFPLFDSYDKIYNSIDSTYFVSKHYFEKTIDILFNEFLTYFNPLFVKMCKLIEEKKTGAGGDESEDKAVQTEVEVVE